MKYIPQGFAQLFNVEFLKQPWKHGETLLLRAERLYTAQNYRSFLQTLKSNFPDYVYYCPYRKKEIISVPIDSIKEIYVPSECLYSLLWLKRKDGLQEMAVSLLHLLSSEAAIDLKDFGIHGSIALGMHTDKSDIDLVVYGSENFRKLEAAIDRLVNEGRLRYRFNNRLGKARHFKLKYRSETFMYTAVRKPEEVQFKYGTHYYEAVAPIRFSCTVTGDDEAVFRPATYQISDIKPLDERWHMPEACIPESVVSMIGCYRNVARKGQRIVVSGTIEKVSNIESGKVSYQVVVGTATSEEESICPL